MLALSQRQRALPGDPSSGARRALCAADAPAVRIEKLGTLFAQRAAVDATAVPLLAELLSIPEAPAIPSALTPAQRKAATIALLVDEIARLGKTDPVLLVLEDAQWIDATTLELLTQLIDSIGPARLLAAVTARPDFAPPWLARPHATMLTWAGSAARNARNWSRSRRVARAAGRNRRRDRRKSDGVPLFVEELTKSVMETAGEDAAAVPATLKDSLMARLDRLGEAREVAQLAAVIGRQFAFALLAAVARRPEAELDVALAKLGAAGIVFPEGRGLERGFSFKHALVRDAAYESLLLARRRDWHARIGRALEEKFPETAANEPELLAHHYGEAGRRPLATTASGGGSRRRPLGLSRSDRAFFGRPERGRAAGRPGRAPAPAIGVAAEARAGADDRRRRAKRGGRGNLSPRRRVG